MITDKLTATGNFEKPCYVDELQPDGQRELPSPCVPCTWHDYWHVRGCFSPGHVSFFQMYKDKQFSSFTIEWFHNVAFAIRHPQKWRCGKEGEPSVVYEEPPQYFRIGCQHEWGGKMTDSEKASIPSGRCINPYKCKKCGFFQVVDSSD